MKHINEYSDFLQSLNKEGKINEGPGKGYYIEVAVRDARKALAILDDMYRKKFDINGSNVYYFNDEDMAYDAKMDLAARDIEIIDTNIEESLDEDADPCWDNYKIGSPKTKISSQSGKRVNNCVPIDESEVNEAEDYKYKKYVSKAFDKISDAIFEFRNAMGVKQLGQADPKLKKRLEAMQSEIFALRRDMKSEGLTESVNEAEFKHINKEEHQIKLAIKDVEKKVRLKANRGKPIEYEQLSLNKIMLSKVLGREKLGKEHQDAWKRLKKEYNLTESLLSEATDINDPVLMAFRATRRELPKFTPAKSKTRRISFDKYLDLLDSQTDIDQDIKDKAEEMAQTFRDMEQEAEPEGGKMADKYGSIMMKQENEYAKLKAKKAKIDARVEKYRMS
tara:strand:+ start:3076 stop:4251 length:1176 start_codon:yes stop_codon:yes gene_type:complete